MDFKAVDGVLSIFLAGRIDSHNADQTGAEIDKILGENPAESVVFDAENLEYISSAGLRVVLRIRKARPELKIINVSSEVYEIFEMTGFSEMMPIEKAYRRVSVDGCEVIGQGANGKVYRLDPDTIIKVYLNPDSLSDIHRERELARTAFVAGIPTAIPYDVVKVGEGYGSVFELLSAKSFAKLIAAEPENLDKYVGLYVDLLKKIHSTVINSGNIPNQKEVTLDWVRFLKEYLPESTYNKLYGMVEAIPESKYLMHGDYHIKNVMMQNDEVLLIDMDTLCLGNPVFEFASIYLAYVGFSELNHDNVQSFLGIPFETAGKIWDKTLRMYFGTDDETVLEEVANKAKIIGYTRLMRRTIRRNGFNDELGKKTIELAKNNIIELVDKVSSLEY